MSSNLNLMPFSRRLEDILSVSELIPSHHKSRDSKICLITSAMNVVVVAA